MKVQLILFVCFFVLAPLVRSQLCACRDMSPCDVWDTTQLVAKANVTDVTEDTDNNRVVYTLFIIDNYRGGPGNSLLNKTNVTSSGPSVSSGSTVKVLAPPFDHPCAVVLEVDHVYLITAGRDSQGNLFTSKCLMIVACDHQVCGSDGKTYNTECELREEMCTNPSANLYKRGDHACQKTCDVRKCGTRPLIPERMCSDGVTLSGVGYCITSGSNCVWDIVACPCESGLNVFPDGYTSISNTDPCIVDVCDNGQLLSSSINCPPPPCNSPLVLPGTCCPICPEPQQQPTGNPPANTPPLGQPQNPNNPPIGQQGGPVGQGAHGGSPWGH